MSRVGLTLRAVRLAAIGSTADPTPDYDLASPTYDDAFTSVMGPHSSALLDLLTIRPGDDVVELACGTGHLTEQIARRLEGAGSVRVVEKSPGMLEVARAKVTAAAEPGLRLAWREGDMTEFLHGLPSRSADVVVDALETLRNAFEEVVSEDPSMLTGFMRVSLPRNAATVAGWFRRAGLRTEVVSEGAQEWPCRTAEQALDWVERSGAGAGFRDSFDMGREAEIRERLFEALTRAADRPEGLRLTHSFVVGVARADGEPRRFRVKR
jgi:ubiquinone/menaquinone biosynthesis C-methylase UbiE